MKKTIKIILETKLYPGIFLLKRIYVVLTALPQKQVCHYLKRTGEDESKIIGDIGNRVFCLTLDLDFQSENEKSNYFGVIKSVQ